jgi:hypothetical protein
MTSTEVKRFGARRVLQVIVPILLITGGTLGYLAYTGNAVAPALNSGTNASSQVKVEFAVAVNHQEQKIADFPWLLQMALKGEFWRASCYFFCNGVTYTMDPTIITNEGVDYIQCIVFGVTHADTGYTCTVASGATNRAQDIAVSATSGAGDAATDTYAGSTGGCYSGIVLTTNGFILASPTTTPAVTVTAGTPASNSVTTTIAVTYTATGTQANVQSACLLTGTSGTIYLVAEGTFGPDSLVSGNTLTITWSMTTS